MLINGGSKRVIGRKDVPFAGLNHVPLNFGSRTPKTEILVPELDFQPCKQNVQVLITLITTNFLQLRLVVPRPPPTNPRWRMAAMLNLEVFMLLVQSE